MPRKRSNRQGKLFAAKLLFQWRVIVDGVSSKRRTCEERIIHIRAHSARSALRKAIKKGRSGEFDYSNNEGNPVFFEFIGVLDLLSLGIECEAGEVWYEIKEMLTPMERKDAIVPPEHTLTAIQLRGV